MFFLSRTWISNLRQTMHLPGYSMVLCPHPSTWLILGSWARAPPNKLVQYSPWTISVYLLQYWFLRRVQYLAFGTPWILLHVLPLSSYPVPNFYTQLFSHHGLALVTFHSPFFCHSCFALPCCLLFSCPAFHLHSSSRSCFPPGQLPCSQRYPIDALGAAGLH